MSEIVEAVTPCMACNGHGRYRNEANFGFQEFCPSCCGTGKRYTPMSVDQHERYQAAIRSGRTQLQAVRDVNGSQSLTPYRSDRTR